MSGPAPMSGLRPAQGNRGDGWASDLSFHLAPAGGGWELANLVLLLQVQRSLRKSMSRGVCECLPSLVMLCVLPGRGPSLWASPRASPPPPLTPSLSPPPCRAPVGSQHLGEGEGVPRDRPNPTPD